MKQAWLQFVDLFLLLSKWGLFVCTCALIYLLGSNSLQHSWKTADKAASAGVEQKTEVRSLEDEIENGIHLPTGLVYAEGFEWVRGTCTACHSAKLVTQNRATREGWLEMIRWMQASQGLWDLGDQEKPILDYLTKHYAPEDVGRRKPLDVASIEWYILELD